VDLLSLKSRFLSIFSVKIEDDKRYLHFAQHKINAGKIYTNDDVFVKLSQILK
jgi:hypothetical protein